jgi:ABC-type multidrug transport system fused ATPase/permease subunit
MFQDVYMFNGTIAENIAYPGKPDPDRVNEVMEKAQLTEFVGKLPNGAQEIVEADGANFSGGECQRIALARMLYKEADIYLLDEPTAALDANTSKAIFDVLADENRNGKTIIAITHDAGKATYGNKVIVVSGGRIIEYGPPAKLLEQNGAFASLYEAQTKMD